MGVRLLRSSWLAGFEMAITVAILLRCASSLCAQRDIEFSSTDPVTINTPNVPGPGGKVTPSRAAPYPSIIDVSGFEENETIAKITLTLLDLSHEVPDDIDILLVGPRGQNIVCVSDAGGGFVDASVTITLDDEAAAMLPDDESFGSGRFKPSNYEPDDDEFPFPAPPPSTAVALSVFANTNPNGPWYLYVVDDDVFDAGQIAGGWTLTIRTGGAPPLFRRGDADGNAVVNITDAVFVLNALFLGGAGPGCAQSADTDDNGALNISDAVFLLDHLFRGGAGLPAPGPTDCGVDATEDDLGCSSGLSCGGP